MLLGCYAPASKFERGIKELPYGWLIGQSECLWRELLPHSERFQWYFCVYDQ